MRKVDLPRSKVDSIKTRLTREYSKISEQIFSNKDPLSVTLKAHLVVERLMDDIIRDSSEHPDYVCKRTFDQKVEILFFASLLDDVAYKKIKALNSLRNKFAHNINYKLTRQDVKSFFSTTNSVTNFQKLAKGIGYLIGYIHALREVNRHHPFAHELRHKYVIYKKDRLFQYVEKELHKGLSEFKLEGWKFD